MISTILFDNDGVLVDTERVFYESNRHMLEEFGVKLNETEFSKLSLSKGMSLADIIVSLGNTLKRRKRRAGAGMQSTTGCCSNAAPPWSFPMHPKSSPNCTGTAGSAL